MLKCFGLKKYLLIERERENTTAPQCQWGRVQFSSPTLDSGHQLWHRHLCPLSHLSDFRVAVKGEEGEESLLLSHLHIVIARVCYKTKESYQKVTKETRNH